MIPDSSQVKVAGHWVHHTVHLYEKFKKPKHQEVKIQLFMELLNTLSFLLWHVWFILGGSPPPPIFLYILFIILVFFNLCLPVLTFYLCLPFTCFVFPSPGTNSMQVVHSVLGLRSHDQSLQQDL